jgi:hypothetical protein
MESEYIATADVANEDVWLQKFVLKLGVLPEMRDPIHIHCDDKAALQKLESWGLTCRQTYTTTIPCHKRLCKG